MKETYLAAQEPKQLEAYIKSCKVCNFRYEANSRLQNLKRQEQYTKLNAAGTNEQAVKQFLIECGDACPQDVREEGEARLAAHH